MKKQRIAKIPIHYRDQIQQILDDLEQNGRIERVGLNAARNNELGSDISNRVIILPIGDTYNIVMDARLLNAMTDVSKYHFPLLPVQILTPRINGKICGTTDVSTADHQIALTPETEELVYFVVRDEEYNYKRSILALKASPVFFARILTISFAPLVERNEIITYIDDIVVQAVIKPQMFERLRNFHGALRNSKLIASPDRTSFFLLAVKFLRHIVALNKIKPLLNKMELCNK